MRKQSFDRELFLRTLSEDDAYFDSQSVARLTEQVKIPRTGAQYYCIAVRYADPQKSLMDMQMPIKLLSACQEAAQKAKKDITCYLGAHLYVVMIVIDERMERDWKNHMAI